MIIKANNNKLKKKFIKINKIHKIIQSHLQYQAIYKFYKIS